jgi:hypothetical protein
MDDYDTVTADTEIPAAWIHDVQAVPFLLAHICEAQLIGIEEFDDPAFERHAYNFVI